MKFLLNREWIGGIVSSLIMVGDWLSVAGITGEVIDLDPFGLRLQEIDLAGKSYPFTGKTHLVFNSRLLASSFSNLSFKKNFVAHDVPVPLQLVSVDPELLMVKFQKITEKHFTSHREEAKQFNAEFERVAGLDLHDAEPQWFQHCKELDHYHRGTYRCPCVSRG